MLAFPYRKALRVGVSFFVFVLWARRPHNVEFDRRDVSLGIPSMLKRAETPHGSINSISKKKSIPFSEFLQSNGFTEEIQIGDSTWMFFHMEY